MAGPGLGLPSAQRLAAGRGAADADRRSAFPARRTRGFRNRRARRARAPAGVGARRRDRHHAGRGAPPIARRRLSGHAVRPPDDVPQPHTKAHALCRGDGGRTTLETMITPTWSPRRLHALDDAQIDERECGKTLLVLDTANSEAERLYERLGWERVGVIPGYALLPQGGLCGTTVYYRNLG